VFIAENGQKFLQALSRKRKRKTQQQSFHFSNAEREDFFKNGEKKHTQIKNDRTLGKGLKKKKITSKKVKEKRKKSF